MNPAPLKPSNAFIVTAWIALGLGALGFLSSLWNAAMSFNDKGYYMTLLFFGLFSAVSLQKSIRDKIEGVPVTSTYYGICWIAVLLSFSLMVGGLFNAIMAVSEKGFYAMAFALSLFAAVTVQKNVRDIRASEQAPQQTTQQPNETGQEMPRGVRRSPSERMRPASEA